MARQHTTAKSNHSILFCVATSVAMTLAVTILLMVGLTSLTINGTIGEHMVGPFVFLVRTFAILVGCLLGTGLSKGKHLQVIGSSALAFLVILLGLGIVVYDGSIQKLGFGCLSVLLGAAITCLIRVKAFGKRKSPVRYSR